MIEVREVLRAWLAGEGLRRVAELSGTDRKTARRYVEAAVAAGLVRDGGVGQVDDALIGAVVAAVRPARPAGHGAGWEACVAEHVRIQAWVKADVTATKIVELLERRGVRVPYRTVARYVVERCDGGRGQGATVRVADGEPGVECQIDFARLGLIPDPVAGRRRVAHVLIFTAVHSRHMFAWVTFTQTLAAVVTGCEAAWEFFGGVFKVLIPDNLSPVVSDADSVNPTFTVGWTEYAQSRGFFTDPARVRSPKDKPKVERAVQYVRSSFFAAEDFTDLAQARARAIVWSRDVAGLRVHGTTQARPAEVFTAVELPVLLPAPAQRYDVPDYVTAKVHRDHHIEVAKALYSLPGDLIGQQVQVRADSALVKVFHRGQLVKTHPRVEPGRRSTDRTDYPEHTAAYAFRDIDALIAQAAAHGPAVAEYARRLLDVELPWTRMRQVYRLLGLARRHGGPSVDAACAKLLAIDGGGVINGVIDLRRVTRILDAALEHAVTDSNSSTGGAGTSGGGRVVVPAAARFARDASEFAVSTPGSTT